MTFKAIALVAQIFFPSADDPRVQATFRQMTTDYATCAAYFDLQAAYYHITSPHLTVRSLGGVANAGYEGHRTEALANLPRGTFEARQAAMKRDMIKTLETLGFAGLYSTYDSFCEDLREDPGRAFLRRLPPKSAPMK